MTINTSARTIITTIITVAAIACGGSKSAPPAATPHNGSGAMADMCPMEVPGTQVSVADTQDGVAVAFMTSGDVAQVRQRVHGMAAMHEKMMSGGGMMGSGGMGSGGMMGSGSGGMMGSGHMMKMVDSTAQAEDIDGGARIVLTPKDPAKLAELRDHVREHAGRMASGHCPMMEAHEQHALRAE